MDPRAAIDWAGSQAELARKLDVSPAAVSQWVADGRIPKMRAYQIQVVSKGAVKADPAAYRDADQAA